MEYQPKNSKQWSIRKRIKMAGIRTFSYGGKNELQLRDEDVPKVKKLGFNVTPAMGVGRCLNSNTCTYRVTEIPKKAPVDPPPYTLLDFFNELATWVPNRLSDKQKEIAATLTPDNSPEFRRLLKAWVTGSFDEMPDVAVDQAEIILHNIL